MLRSELNKSGWGIATTLNGHRETVRLHPQHDLLKCQESPSFRTAEYVNGLLIVLYCLEKNYVVNLYLNKAAPQPNKPSTSNVFKTAPAKAQ